MSEDDTKQKEEEQSEESEHEEEEFDVEDSADDQDGHNSDEEDNISQGEGQGDSHSPPNGDEEDNPGQGEGQGDSQSPPNGDEKETAVTTNDTKSSKAPESSGKANRKRSHSEEIDKQNRSTEKKKPKTADALPSFTPAPIAGSYYGSSNNVPSGHGNVISQTDEATILEIAPDKVGQIIGSKGMIIQEIQSRTGAKAYVNQDFPQGVNRQVQLSGTPQQVQAACDFIRRIIEQGPTAIHVNSIHGGPPTTRLIECSQSQVGKIIGSGGATIKDIQAKSGAKIQIDQDYPPEVPRKIHISGSTAAVNVAVQLIMNVMSNISNASSHSSQPPSQHRPASYLPQTAHVAPYPQPVVAYATAPPVTAPMATGPDVTQTMDVQKSIVGRIIGRGGETIQLIQRKSGCRVTLDQNVPEGMPCKVMFTGSPSNISLAVSMVQEINMGVHTSQIGANLPAPSTAAPAPYAAAPVAQPYGVAPSPYGAYGYPPQAIPYGQPYGAPPAGTYYAYPGVPPQAPAAAAPAYVPPVAHSSSAPHGHHLGVHHSHHTAHHSAPAPAPKPAASSVWTEHKTDDGLTYWYNASTGVSQVLITHRMGLI